MSKYKFSTWSQGNGLSLMMTIQLHSGRKTSQNCLEEVSCSQIWTCMTAWFLLAVRQVQNDNIIDLSLKLLFYLPFDCLCPYFLFYFNGFAIQVPLWKSCYCCHKLTSHPIIIVLYQCWNSIFYFFLQVIGIWLIYACTRPASSLINLSLCLLASLMRYLLI